MPRKASHLVPEAVRVDGLTYCPVCGREHTRNTDYDRHYLGVHLNVKLCQCKICPRVFAQKAQLTTHTRTHTGEAPHECRAPGCGQRFKDVSSCGRHEKNLHNLYERRRPLRAPGKKAAKSRRKPKGPAPASAPALPAPAPAPAPVPAPAPAEDRRLDLPIVGMPQHAAAPPPLPGFVPAASSLPESSQPPPEHPGYYPVADGPPIDYDCGPLRAALALDAAADQQQLEATMSPGPAFTVSSAERESMESFIQSWKTSNEISASQQFAADTISAWSTPVASGPLFTYSTEASCTQQGPYYVSSPQQWAQEFLGIDFDQMLRFEAAMARANLGKLPAYPIEIEG